MIRGKLIACAIAAMAALTLCLPARAETGIFDFERVPGMVAGMVFVEGGCFVMGDRFGDGFPDERPTHEVCLDDYYFGKYEVTLGAFSLFVEETGYKTTAEKGGGCLALVGTDWVTSGGATWKDPGFRQGYNSPVTCVSYEDAEAFARWKSRKDRRTYRLPTEAEWEYASRNRGRNLKYTWGNHEDTPTGNIYDTTAQRNLGPIAALDEYYDGYIYTAPVASQSPNLMGIHGLSGNLWEWTLDYYSENYYSRSPRTNPRGPEKGESRVIRGGSWYSKQSCLRTSKRSSLPPGESHTIVGFRLVLEARQ